MKKLRNLLVLTGLIVLHLQATTLSKLYVFESGSIRFFSETPVENIEAKTEIYAAVLNPETRKFAFKVLMTSFEFEKSLMQEHFNENYMESEKYPNGTFSGEIVEDIDLLKDGEYSFTAKGTLEIHGVKQTREIPVKATVKKGKLDFSSDFQVKLVDHNIEVPSIVVKNIAEVIDVGVKGVLTLKK